MSDDPIQSAPLERRLAAAGRAMHDACLPAPDFPPAALLAILEARGERWQLHFDDEMCAWVAIRRPTPTAQHVIVAFSLPELDIKIARAEEESND